MSSKRAAHNLTVQVYSNILKNVGMKAPKEPKTPAQLERHFKGVANHHRIRILLLVAARDGITVEEISDQLNANFKTISVHTHKLVQAGLLTKKYLGRSVTHSLSPYGKIFYRFIKSF